jgi:hypothetical protein
MVRENIRSWSDFDQDGLSRHHIPQIEVHWTFFIGILEWQNVHTPKPNTLEDLKLATHQEIWKVTQNIYRDVTNNFKKRREHVIEQKWRHVQHVL